MKLRRIMLTERQRKFAREVGSIVLGVLIALGLGAVANEVGWWVEVSSARRANSLELGETIGASIQRVAMDQCVERRLDELATIVDEAATTGRLPPLGNIQRPPFRTWDQGVWESTVNAQTASHFDRNELTAFSSISNFVSWLNELSRRELQVWTTLYTMVGPGRAVTPVEIAALRGAISEARLTHRSIMVGGIRIQQFATAYDLPYDAVEMRNSRDRVIPYICRPISATVPDHYGQAPLSNVLETTRRTPITRPKR